MSLQAAPPAPESPRLSLLAQLVSSSLGTSGRLSRAVTLGPQPVSAVVRLTQAESFLRSMEPTLRSWTSHRTPWVLAAQKALKPWLWYPGQRVGCPRGVGSCGFRGPQAAARTRVGNRHSMLVGQAPRPPVPKSKRHLLSVSPCCFQNLVKPEVRKLMTAATCIGSPSAEWGGAAPGSAAPRPFDADLFFSFHFKIMIFPEGTCTNRTCLITFKPGMYFPQ